MSQAKTVHIPAREYASTGTELRVYRDDDFVAIRFYAGDVESVLRITAAQALQFHAALSAALGVAESMPEAA